MKRLIYIGNKLEDLGATPTSVDILSKLLKKEGFIVISASAKKMKLLRFLEMQWIIIQNRKTAQVVLIDTYSTQNFWYAYFTGHLCRLLKLKYIPILRGGNLPDRIESSPKASYNLFHHAFVNIVPSHFLFDLLISHNIKNIRFIPNSIPLQHYIYKDRINLRPKILWVRAFDKIYNPMLAMNILQMLLKRYPDGQLCMVGPDKDGSLENCRKFAKKNDLPVKFTGKLKKKEWIRLSEDYDIFINTSNIDNTPVSVIEAMALGLPVVSTNVGGIPYLVEEGVTGSLVPPNNPEAMAEKIVELLEKPEKAASFSHNGREKVKGFDWNLIKVEWLKVLN